MNSFVKSIVIPFVVSLLIFSLIAVFAVPPVIELVFGQNKTSANEKTDDKADDDISSLSSLKSRANGTLTLMLIGTDEARPDEGAVYPPVITPGDRESEIRQEYERLAEINKADITKTVEFITIVTFDSLRSTVNVTCLPPESVIAFRRVNIPLNDMLYYSENKMYETDLSFFADYTTSLIGYEVDYYAYIDIDDWAVFADDHPGIKVPLNETVTVTSSSGRTSKLYNAGTLTLTGADLLALVRFDGYKNIGTKCALLENFCIGALDIITTAAYYSEVDKGIDKCLSSFYETNIDKDSFKEDVPLFFSYKYYTHSALDIVGELYYSGGKQYFLPDKKATADLFRK